MRRRLGVVAATVITLLLAVAPLAWGAARDRITVDPGKTVTRSFPAILGSNPAQKQHNDDLNEPSDPDPGTCASLPSCDVIPLTMVQPPTLSVFDSFSMRIELRGQGGDLDLYLWYDPPGAVPAKVSKGNDDNEVINFPAPTSRNYTIVVSNALGVNSGYSVTVFSKYVKGERPSDLDIVPSFPTTPEFGISVPSTSVVPSVVAPDLSSTTSTLLDTLDPDLSNLNAAGRARDIFSSSDTSGGPPRPVPGFTIFVWAILVPGVAASVAVAVLYRRRPRALHR